MQQKSSRTITRNDLMVCLPRSRSLAHTAHTHTSAEQALLLSSRHNRRCLEADRGLLSFSFSSILFSLSPSLSLSLSLPRAGAIFSIEPHRRHVNGVSHLALSRTGTMRGKTEGAVSLPPPPPRAFSI
jgi:hypothetical protein